MKIKLTSYDFANVGAVDNWINGEFVPARGGDRQDVINPRHGKAMASVAMSGQADVDAAVAAAKAAFKDWAATPIKERVQVFYNIKQLMQRDFEDLAWLVSHENGKTYDEGKASVAKSIECLEFGISLPNMIAEGSLDVSRGVRCTTFHEPLGVVGGITPFNFPIMVPFWMLPQALVAGNTFVLKPSEKVPTSMSQVALLFREAGLPKGVLNIVNGGKPAVDGLLANPDIQALGFVGSTPIAKYVYAEGAKTGRRMLCLGGAKNHLIVVPDADPDMTARDVAASFTGCAGQRCMAASVLVAVGQVDHIITGIVEQASKLELGKTMGPIINKESVARIRRYIDQAEANGAKVLLDGRKTPPPEGCEGGNWIGPTILDQVPAGSPAACDEIFGPVISIVRTNTLDEALALENASPYGNAASIYTSTGATARYAIERVRAGMNGINIGVPVPREPFGFGGWFDSKFGHGDMTGYDGFRFWTQPRKVTEKWALQKDATWMS
jgi:malonate-semialdehyde dehydrogenase (acetylating)/methylmalonate-semialdehyde dehydrogenase